MATNFNSNHGHGNGLVKHVVFNKNGTQSKAGALNIGYSTYFQEELTYGDAQQIAMIPECFDSVTIYRARLNSSGGYTSTELVKLERSKLGSAIFKITEKLYWGEALYVVATKRADYSITSIPSWIRFDAPAQASSSSSSNSSLNGMGVLNVNTFNGLAPLAVTAWNTLDSYSVWGTFFQLNKMTLTVPSNLHNSAVINFNDLFPAGLIEFTRPACSCSLTMNESIDHVNVKVTRNSPSFLSTNLNSTVISNQNYSSNTVLTNFEPGDIVELTATVVSNIGNSYYLNESAYHWVVGGEAYGVTSNVTYFTCAYTATADFWAASYSNLKARTLNFSLFSVTHASSYWQINYVFTIENVSTHASREVTKEMLGVDEVADDVSLALGASDYLVSAVATWNHSHDSPQPNNATATITVRYGNTTQGFFQCPYSGGHTFTDEEIGWINYPEDTSSASTGGSTGGVGGTTIHPWDPDVSTTPEDPGWTPGGGGSIGGGGTGGCVQKDTPILVSAKGDIKAAREVCIGDIIMGWKDDKLVETKVIQKYFAHNITKLVRMYLSNKTFLEFTPNHPILCENNVYKAYDNKAYEQLTVDDKVVTIDGLVEIEAIDLLQIEPEIVLNFLTETDNFIATEVVVAAESPDTKGVFTKDPFGSVIGGGMSKVDTGHHGGLGW